MFATDSVSWCLFLVTLQLIQTVSSFKCYVCAPDEGKPEDMYTLRKSFPTHDIQSCSAFTKSKRHLYLLECPHGGSNGCLTKFEANGSVMRTCAPIAFDDCRKANGINYCYCKKEGCNTPERRLQSPDQPEVAASSSLGQSQAAARVAVSDKSFTRFFDDEDMGEGSGDWGDFYYDDYNYGYYPSQEFDDSEPGLGGRDDEDMTEPPPFLDLETPVQEHEATHRHKFDRGGQDHRGRPQRPHPGHADATDITIVDDTESSRPTKTTGGASGLVSSWSLLVIAVFLSELLVRI